MDDFEYSIQISDLDWDAFFQACEECNMLPPGLAAMDDSGMSDMDDVVIQQTPTATKTTLHNTELQVDGPPDNDGSPVDLYLSKYGLNSADQILSGSEDDFHLEAVNMFFERLKNVSGTRESPNLGSEMAGNLQESDVKEDSKKIVDHRNQTSQKNDHHNYMMCTDSTDDDLDGKKHKSTFPNTELIITEEDCSLGVLKAGGKLEDKMITQADTINSPYNVPVNGKQLKDPNQVKEAKCQLVTSNNSDLLVLQGQASSVTPRRRRRKKKKISVELGEMELGYEVHLSSKVSDSDEDTCRRRREMDQDTHIVECCGSGTVSEACQVPHDFLEHPMVTSISETFSGLSQSVPYPLLLQSTLVIPEFSKSSTAQTNREIAIMSDNLPEKPADTECHTMKADVESPEPVVSFKKRPQCDDSLSVHTNGDNEENHLQLNYHLPTEMLVSIASSDVSTMENKPVVIDSLVSNHTDDANSQTHSTALQPAPLIISRNVVYSKTTKSQFENRVTLCDVQFDEFCAVGQGETSISCVTFPDLKDKTHFTASYKNSEENSQNSLSVIHDEVPHEQKNDYQVKRRLSEPFDFKLLTQADHANMAERKEQNGHMTQMFAAPTRKADEIKDAASFEPIQEITYQKESKADISTFHRSVNSQSEECIEENCPSVRFKNVPESQNSINMKFVEILSSGIEEDTNQELFLKGQIKEYQSLIPISEPDSQLSDYSELEPTMSTILTSGDEERGQILHADTPPCLSSKDHDLSPTIVEQHSPAPPPVSTDEVKGLETVGPDSVNHPTPPVYAMSSFWNEMEKLTINDILLLRLVGQAQHPSVLLQPEDNHIADVTDAVDSGYFTHSDESKPDRSSDNISFISDFDGEFAQPLASDATKLDEATQGSPTTTSIIWESDPNLSGTTAEMEDVYSLDTAHSSSILRSNSSHCFRKMCKNSSVQNLQALEDQNVGKMLRNASLHTVYSTHSKLEDSYEDPFDHVETSSPVYLSDEEEMDSTGITFSEIFEYLFGTDEPKQSASEPDIVAACYLSGTETSVHEMYDHFFSEFEPENLFFPLAEDSSSTNEEFIPIFSSSHTATRDVQFPEVYDYFFPDDSPVHSDEDEEPEHTVIRVVTRYDHTPTKNHDSDPYKQFSPQKDKSWNFIWTNPFSFRRVRRTGVTIPLEAGSSQALAPIKNTRRSFRGGIQAINILGADQSPFPDALILSVENCIFRQLTDQQKICSEMQTVVADPRLDAPLLPIKQADMCLVCIAFASWVLKSVNPQGVDNWKAVVLANISALSAIRYLRRFTRDEVAKISPLHQIKPA